MRDWDVSSEVWTPAAAHICWWPGRCSEALNVISGQQSLNKSSRVTFWSRLVWLLDTHTDWAAGGNSGQDSVLQSANYSQLHQLQLDLFSYGNTIYIFPGEVGPAGNNNIYQGGIPSINNYQNGENTETTESGLPPSTSLSEQPGLRSNSEEKWSFNINVVWRSWNLFLLFV